MPTWNEYLVDDAAFAELFKEYFKPLCAYCQYRFDFELDTAREVVHAGFIKLWENRNSLTPSLPVKAYLYKIVINTSLDIIRHEKIKQRHVRFVFNNTSESTEGDVFDQPDLKQMAADIDKAVSELPGQMRRIFELSRYEGLKYGEISGKLDISIKTVETQMSRALVKLRQKLAHYLTVAWVLFLLNQ